MIASDKSSRWQFESSADADECYRFNSEKQRREYFGCQQATCPPHPKRVQGNSVLFDALILLGLSISSWASWFRLHKRKGRHFWKFMARSRGVFPFTIGPLQSDKQPGSCTKPIQCDESRRAIHFTIGSVVVELQAQISPIFAFLNPATRAFHALICSQDCEIGTGDSVLDLFNALNLLVPSILESDNCCRHKHRRFLHFQNPATQQGYSLHRYA